MKSEERKRIQSLLVKIRFLYNIKYYQGVIDGCEEVKRIVLDRAFASYVKEVYSNVANDNQLTTNILI